MFQNRSSGMPQPEADRTADIPAPDREPVPARGQEHEAAQDTSQEQEPRQEQEAGHEASQEREAGQEQEAAREVEQEPEAGQEVGQHEGGQEQQAGQEQAAADRAAEATARTETPARDAAREVPEAEAAGRQDDDLDAKLAAAREARAQIEQERAEQLASQAEHEDRIQAATWQPSREREAELDIAEPEL